MDFIKIAQDIFDFLVQLIILPIKLILAPVDALISTFPGMSQVPGSINSLISQVGKIPETIVYLTGINPIMFNLLFIVFVAYLVNGPMLQFFTKIWSWMR